MNKTIAIIAATLSPVALLFGCDRPSPSAELVTAQNDTAVETKAETETETNDKEVQSRIEIVWDNENGFFGRASGLPGVRRRFAPDRSGTYTVEYIHAPYGTEKDDTLDYKLTLNSDNTYTLSVVSEGVRAEHYGHWYERRGNINIYYDEPMEDMQHNIYVSDSLYGELLEGGKIMIFDNCHTIVLAKQAESDTNR